jgi:hypothetical protein
VAGTVARAMRSAVSARPTDSPSARCRLKEPVRRRVRIAGEATAPSPAARADGLRAQRRGALAHRQWLGRHDGRSRRERVPAGVRARLEVLRRKMRRPLDGSPELRRLQRALSGSDSLLQSKVHSAALPDHVRRRHLLRRGLLQLRPDLLPQRHDAPGVRCTEEWDLPPELWSQLPVASDRPRPSGRSGRRWTRRTLLRRNPRPR